MKYSLSLKGQEGINDNAIKTINYFKVMLGKKIKGSYKSGMNYYPYVEFEYPLNINSSNNSDINSSLYESIYLGCFITYRKLWFEPIFKFTSENKVKYNGIKIGIWNYFGKNKKKSIRLK